MPRKPKNGPAWYVCYWCHRDSIALEYWDVPDGPFPTIDAAIAFLCSSPEPRDWSDDIVKIEIVRRELVSVSVR